MKPDYYKKIMRPATDRKTKPDEIEVKDESTRNRGIKGGKRKV